MAPAIRSPTGSCRSRGVATRDLDDALLVRLHPEDAWEDWGDDWWNLCNRVGQLHFVGGWLSAPAWVAGCRPGRRLDWGAWMHELSLPDVLRLVGEEPLTAASRSSEGEDGRDQRALLTALDPHGSYSVVWREDADTAR